MVYEDLNANIPIISYVNKEQREQLAVLPFLGGSRTDYDMIRSQILGGVDLTSLVDTFSRWRVSYESSIDSVEIACASLDILHLSLRMVIALMIMVAMKAKEVIIVEVVMAEEVEQKV